MTEEWGFNWKTGLKHQSEDLTRQDGSSCKEKTGTWIKDMRIRTNASMSKDEWFSQAKLGMSSENCDFNKWKSTDKGHTFDQHKGGWRQHNEYLIKTYQDKNEDCTSQKRTKASKIVAMRCYARYSQTGFASPSDPRFPRFAWLLGKPSHEWFSRNSSYPYLDCNAMTQISRSMTLWQSNIVRKDPSFISIYTWTMWFHQL